IDDTLINQEGINSMKSHRKKDDKHIKNSDTDYKDEKKGSSKLITFTAIILALLLTVGLTAGFLWLRGQIQGNEVKVIDVRGLHKDVAEEKLKEINLVMRVKNEVYSSEYEKDYVISQSVEAGETVKEGYPIEVTISKGIEVVD